jgi:hypothetical protein
MKGAILTRASLEKTACFGALRERRNKKAVGRV